MPAGILPLSASQELKSGQGVEGGLGLGDDNQHDAEVQVPGSSISGGLPVSCLDWQDRQDSQGQIRDLKVS